MNLQIVSPYKKCPFTCPMCIASTKEDYQYENLYAIDKVAYANKLWDNIMVGDYSTFVLTGDTEPTLFPEWLQMVSDYVEKYATIWNNTPPKIELQTKNYMFDTKQLPNVDVISYSFTNKSDFEKMINLNIEKTNRATILLTKEVLNEVDLKAFFRNNDFQEVTFKMLQESADSATNDYISEVKATDTDITLDFLALVGLLTYQGISVRIDENCMDTENRYKIFRIDGELYHKWF